MDAVIEKLESIEKKVGEFSELPTLIERMLILHQNAVPIKIVYMIVGATFMGFAGGASVKIIADYFRLIHNVP